MQNRRLNLTAFLALLLVSPRALTAQKTAAPSPEKVPSSAAPHDLAGTWDFIMNLPGQGIYATPSRQAPPMTAWGKQKFDAAKPGYGPRATPEGNDPILRCDPSGIPRTLLYPQPFEIMQTSDRVFMFFEHEHLWRQIWLNRRTHPQDIAATWIGDSVGWWENNTFVVDTAGFNDKTWLDFYGYPHSEEMHLVERYQRTDHDTLQLVFTVTDPTAYASPWVSDPKIFKLLPKDRAILEELFCVPEEEDAFANRIRKPAAGK